MFEQFTRKAAAEGKTGMNIFDVTYIMTNNRPNCIGFSNSPDCELNIIIDKRKTQVFATQNGKGIIIFSGNTQACFNEILKKWDKCKLSLSVGYNLTDDNNIIDYYNFNLIPTIQ